MVKFHTCYSPTDMTTKLVFQQIETFSRFSKDQYWLTEWFLKQNQWWWSSCVKTLNYQRCGRKLIRTLLTISDVISSISLNFIILVFKNNLLDFLAFLLLFVSGSPSLLTDKVLSLNSIYFMHATLFQSKNVFSTLEFEIRHRILIMVSDFILVFFFPSESEHTKTEYSIFYTVLILCPNIKDVIFTVHIHEWKNHVTMPQHLLNLLQV